MDDDDEVDDDVYGIDTKAIICEHWRRTKTAKQPIIAIRIEKSSIVIVAEVISSRNQIENFI